MKPIFYILVALGLSTYNLFGDPLIEGELKKWHRLTLTFEGPKSSETATPNPFLDYRLDITFKNGNKVYSIPGYYAVDGNAAETGANSGNKWRVHFSPDKIGEWLYTVSFKKGPSVATLATGKSAGFMDGKTGKFIIRKTDKYARDHRGKGRLKYVGKHYLRFSETGEYFLKCGTDSPENFLAYNDFDNTPNEGKRRKSWSPHQKDWLKSDPSWQNGKGTEIIGAINYLSKKGMNAFSFLTMNIKGDDKNVFPYISNQKKDFLRFDCSKLAQWEIVFAHADKMGMYLHFKTQETENDQLLDKGELGIERKLYYRELIARFSHHLALNWNLGEENTNTSKQRIAFSDYIYKLDPYKHNIVIHTYPGKQDKVHMPLIGNRSKLTGLSIQTNWNNVYKETKKWINLSNKMGKPWVVANDEQGGANTGVLPDKSDPNHDNIRKDVLWGNLMAGGAGCEYYFGYKFPHSDLTCQNFRSRSKMWDQSRHALAFFQDNKIPFWEMRAMDGITNGKRAFAFVKADTLYVIYLLEGTATTLNLKDKNSLFSVDWYDPRNGGKLQKGSIKSVRGGKAINPGVPLNSKEKDWVLLIRKK